MTTLCGMGIRDKHGGEVVICVETEGVSLVVVGEDLEPVGVNNIIKWLTETFPNGCDWKMTDYFEKNFPNPLSNRRIYVTMRLASSRVGIDMK